MNVIEELKFRGLLHTLTDDSVEEKLEKEKVSFYLGADPTGDSLHIGHLVPYMVAKILAKHGHHPILLIGGGTGLIGDPSGKKEERPLLDFDTIMANCDALKKQVEHIIPGATMVNNYDWLKRFSFIEFLRDIGKHFNLNQMLAKDSVKSRLESGISYTEFTYQIIQSLDFLELYQTKNCTVQIGGQDQWGNITAGLELIRKVEGHEAKAYGIVIPLLTKADGTKFGKSAGDAIWLDEAKTSPYEFYQYWMNLEDDEARIRLRQFTDLDQDSIASIDKLMDETPHLRHAQKTTAKYLTTLIHGEDALKQVENITEALFKNKVDTLTKPEIEMGFKGIDSFETTEAITLINALIASQMATSKREARTLIKQNSISVNGDKVNDETFTLDKTNALHNTYTILRRGKKNYGIIKHT